MAAGEVIPTDLYIQPPKELKLKAKSAFCQFVRQFPPEYFMQSDAELITRYLNVLNRLSLIDAEMQSIDDFTTVNDLGTEAVSPLLRAYDLALSQAMKLGMLLRVLPTAREGKLLNVGSGSTSDGRKKQLRLLYKFTPEEGQPDNTRIVDAMSGEVYASGI